MPTIEMYSSELCPFCYRAKALLAAKGVSVQIHDVDSDVELRKEMMERSGGHTVPQIFVDDELIGGCDDLYALERANALDTRLGLT
ncbi:MAG: glutaredoxin 3 [Pseudomonadota bacterium]